MATSSATGLLGCLLSAVFQLFLTLAPIDALASDPTIENFAAATQTLPSDSSDFIMGGADPVHDTFDRAPEPGEMFAILGADSEDRPRTVLAPVADAHAATGGFVHFYHGQAPPLSSLS